jgi:hypothetical protein
MYEFLKHNRMLALALAGTAVFLLWFVLWLAGVLGDDASAPAPVAGAAQSGQTSPPAVTPANATTGQPAPSPATAGRTVNGKQLPAWVPACAPQCPGPWDGKGFYDDLPDAAPAPGADKP